MKPLVSVIIPTYQHAQYVAEAVASVLAQAINAIEVIVVDDGSTDGTDAVIGELWVADPRVRYYYRANQGPCAARNFGLEHAHGDFVQFLDADDLLSPDKLTEQLKALRLHPDCGWCLCDTLIEDEVRGRTICASEQYDYAAKDLGGWIFPQLRDGNFIPIMAPLVRRSVVERLRFDPSKVPEDWFFWMDVARAARLVYIPVVGAIYQHRRTGRSRIPKGARRGLPHIVQPLRLNLGCGTPNTRSWHPMPGLVNLDRSLGWRFEDGLGEFADGSVAGITISHAAMYIPIEKYGYVFSECVRVLKPGGVIRVTEDSCLDPRSSREGGWKGSEPAVTLTFPELFVSLFGALGLEAHVVGPKETYFDDASLIQQQHGEPPDVFFVEGVKRA